ncbi:MAG: CRTAC1 family protein, partial [Bryobacteraceae bacterium]
VLYRNMGDGTFRDVTGDAGLAGGDAARGKPWSIAAGWFDYDNDGDLDLFVMNYVQWDPKAEQFCGDARKRFRMYCHPKYYVGLPNILYRNNGDGTFADVSRSSGIAGYRGKGMGIAFADYDLDGDMDVFAANDTVPNFLFRNEGDGRFAQAALEAGVGFNDDGRALSSMGVDFRDVDNDGLPDLFITALSNETYPLFRNLGKGFFADVTYPSRLGALTLALSGWGNGIFDFDNDGLKDLFAANGNVQDNTELYSSRKSKLPCTVFVNEPGGTFSGVSVGAPAMHRGAAFGDFDGDGLVDVVVTRIGERPLLLRNTSRRENHWIRLRLAGTLSNRDGIGARVKVVAGREQWNHATSSVGYASSSTTDVHFGLGDATHAKLVEIHWPGGAVQQLENVEADRVVTVEEPRSASALP